MAGLLAWAADVVGGNGTDDDEVGSPAAEAVVFSREQQQYALGLDQKASDLRRSINDLRLRIPPAHISQRLPHLHAHNIASNADLALQLNAHSTTKEQAQLREVTLQEENAAYEKSISNCENKIQEKLHEAELLRAKLQELDLIENNLRAELEKALVSVESSECYAQADDSKNMGNSHVGESPEHTKFQELEDKKKELSSMEETVRRLEEEYSVVQEESIKQPSPAQREKLLEKQLHGLVEQLTAKQAQAEGLMSEIRAKEREVERLNGLRKRLDSGAHDISNAARSRLGRGIGIATDYSLDGSNPRFSGGRIESQQKLMFLRSAFVLYILALHVIVFIKISF